MTFKVKALLGVSALTLAFVGGWWAKPSPPPVQVSESSKEASQKTWAEKTDQAASSASQSEKTSQANSETTWYRPDGTLAKRLVLGELSTSRSQAVAVASESRSAEGKDTASRETRREVTPVLPPARAWTLSLGITQDVQAALGRDFRPEVALHLTRGLIGPVGATAFVTAPLGDLRQVRAGLGLTLTLRF